MTLRIQCPSCQAALQIPDSARGKQVRCSKCQTTLKVPENAAPSAPQAAASPTQPSAGPGSLQVKCPGCQSKLSLQASMAGKVVRCSKCQTQLKVPAGGASAPTPQPPASFGGGDLFADLPMGPTTSPLANTGGGGMPAAPRPYSPPPANPYASPARPAKQGAGGRSRGGGSSLPSGRSSAIYIIPAVFMMLWSGLIILVGAFQICLIVFLLSTGKVDFQQVDMARFVGEQVGRLIAIGLQVAVFFGSISMIRRSDLSAARTAAIITTIPCFGCLAFPFGIWATVLLFSDEAKRDFR